jgi:hypothetical protein
MSIIDIMPIDAPHWELSVEDAWSATALVAAIVSALQTVTAARTLTRIVVLHQTTRTTSRGPRTMQAVREALSLHGVAVTTIDYQWMRSLRGDRVVLQGWR